MRAEGANDKLAAWDWRYYAEKLRKAHFDLDEAELKPYFALDNMIAAAFACAQKLFGIVATPRTDIPVWHPDVKVWDIHSARGPPARHFLRRLFRPRVKAQRRLDDGAARSAQDRRRRSCRGPLVLNVMNFSKAPAGRTDAAVVRRCPYAVSRIRPRAAWPVVRCDLSDDFRHPRRHRFRRTAVAALRALAGAAGSPAYLRETLQDRGADAGGIACETEGRAYLQSGLCDGGICRVRAGRSRLPRTVVGGKSRRASKFEKDALARIGMPQEIAMRHRSPHFTHVFSGGGYARRPITAPCGRR